MNYGIAGYAIPPVDQHFFLVLIYEKDGEYYVHELNNSLSKIIAFHKTSISFNKVRLIPTNWRRYVTIGSSSIFAYQKNVGDVHIGTHEEIKSYLEEIRSEIAESPHAKNEIELFLSIIPEEEQNIVKVQDEMRRPLRHYPAAAMFGSLDIEALRQEYSDPPFL